MKLELIAKHEKDSRACRDAFALTLKDMMAADKSVCYVDCDLMGCVNTKQLMAAYPDRAYEAGIAEANAAGVCRSCRNRQEGVSPHLRYLRQPPYL